MTIIKMPISRIGVNLHYSESAKMLTVNIP